SDRRYAKRNLLDIDARYSISPTCQLPNDEFLSQLAADGMTRRSLDERRPLQRVQLHVFGGRDRCRPWDVTQECNFPEVVARSAVAQVPAVGSDRCLPVGDDVEKIAGLAFLDDCATRRLADSVEASRHLFLRGQWQRSEHRNTVEQAELAWRRARGGIDASQPAPRCEHERGQKRAGRDQRA